MQRQHLWLILGMAAVLGVAAGCGRDPLDAGVKALESGDAAGAERHLARATQLRPADAAAWANLGIARLKLGRPDEAIAAFRQAAELDHDDARSLEFAASIQTDRGQWKPALDTLNEAVRRDPKSPRLLTSLALAELHIYGPQTARSRLADVLALAPNYSPAVFNLAVLTRDFLGNPAEAAELFQRYLKLAPTDPHAESAREALSHVRALPTPAATAPAPAGAASRGAAASAPAKTAAGSRNPQAAAEAYNRGVRSQTAGDTAAALAAYSRALQDDPTMASAHYNIGLIYKAKGDTAAARTAFQHALDIAPDMVNARYMLALAYREQGDDDRAASELTALLQRDPRHAEAHLTLGLIYQKKAAKVELARREFTRYLELEPNGRSAKDIRNWLKRQR